MSRIWVTGDLHFNHAAILRYASRPFDTVEAMNAAIVAGWNAMVAPGDIVHVLGDLAVGKRPDDIADIFDRLNGEKHLTVGNHDEENKSTLRLPWASVADLRTIRFETADGGKGRAIACHYPLDTWRNAQRGHLHVHGHSHGGLRTHRPRRVDVGWDAQGGRLVDLARLWDEHAGARYVPVDHHGE